MKKNGKRFWMMLLGIALISVAVGCYSGDSVFCPGADYFPGSEGGRLQRIHQNADGILLHD